jgi:hypothetical protein
MPRAKTARTASSQNTTSTAAAARAAIAPETFPETLKTNGNGNTTDMESEIRQRAYELYEERGRMPGHESEDWIVAEREIVARHTHQSA